MKTIIALLTIIVLSTGSTNSQTNSSQLTGDISIDLKNLLPDGQYIADIMDGIKQSSRQVELAAKFQKNISKNYDWFVDYMKTIPEGEPMPYHKKLGLTKSEYEEFINSLNDIEIVSTGKENVMIEVKNDTINFSSKGKLSNYNLLKIDLKDNTVIYRELKMTFSDTSNITNDKNGLRSKWKGYNWKFEEPNDLSFDDLKDLENLKMKRYSLTIGRLEKNGKTFLSFKGREINVGVKIVDFELPIIF